MTKILVIDDEMPIRRVVRELLRLAGHEVIEAEYGLSGIDLAQTESPDLIMLDLMMPVVDGFEVLTRLREDPISCRIPVIMLTAKIDAASERRCMELGAVDYIKKPWGPQEIEQRVAMALGYPALSPAEAPVKEEVPPPPPPKKATPPIAVDNHVYEPREEPGDVGESEHSCESEEVEESPLARFKIKEFRIRGDPVDNPHLA